MHWGYGVNLAGTTHCCGSGLPSNVIIDIYYNVSEQWNIDTCATDSNRKLAVN